MKKFLHILPRSVFAKHLIGFFGKNFDLDEHEFVICGQEIPMCMDTDFCHLLKKNNILLLKENSLWFCIRVLISNNYHKIYLHGLFNTRLLFALAMLNFILKKSVWVVWGADLYREPPAGLKEIKQKIYFYLLKHVVKRIGEIGAGLNGDYLLAQKRYGARGIYKKLLYPNPIKHDLLDASAAIFNAKSKSNVKRIQVAHSASRSNNHFECLNAISQFVNEELEVICPLSYGDASYSAEVKEIGEKIFGNKKFFVMQQFLSSEKYADYLASIDIAIFGANRQEGLGNIFALLYLGKKVFIKRETTTWGFLTEEIGVKLYDIDTIHSLSYPEFIENSNGIENKNKIKHLFDSKYIASLWADSFGETESMFL